MGMTGEMYGVGKKQAPSTEPDQPRQEEKAKREPVINAIPAVPKYTPGSFSSPE